MADLPSFLFDIGKPGEIREYFFVGLNGEEEFVILDFGDRLTNHKCPLDGVNIISYSGDPHSVAQCPACHKYGFDIEIDSQKEITNKVIPYIKHRTERLKEEINHLEAILRLAQTPENKIKQLNLENSTYNQANLSANESDSEEKNFHQPGSSYC